MAKFTVHRYSTEAVEVEADNEEDALEAAYDSDGPFSEVDYSWAVVSGPEAVDDES